MKTETIVMCVVALILGMLLANMLKSVCGCKVVEGQNCGTLTSMGDGFATCNDCCGSGENPPCQDHHVTMPAELLGVEIPGVPDIQMNCAAIIEEEVELIAARAGAAVKAVTAGSR